MAGALACALADWNFHLRAFAKFAANDLPYDRTDLEMTWLSWRSGAATGLRGTSGFFLNNKLVGNLVLINANFCRFKYCGSLIATTDYRGLQLTAKDKLETVQNLY